MSDQGRKSVSGKPEWENIKFLTQSKEFWKGRAIVRKETAEFFHARGDIRNADHHLSMASKYEVLSEKAPRIPVSELI